MINATKMREARELLDSVDQLFADAGLYANDTASCVYSLRDLIEDLDIDIVRAETGDLE